jgi:hypothetical protein
MLKFCASLFLLGFAAQGWGVSLDPATVGIDATVSGINELQLRALDMSDVNTPEFQVMHGDGGGGGRGGNGGGRGGDGCGGGRGGWGGGGGRGGSEFPGPRGDGWGNSNWGNTWQPAPRPVAQHIICYARNRRGVTYSASGWGSAYSIQQVAVRTCNSRNRFACVATGCYY